MVFKATSLDEITKGMSASTKEKWKEDWVLGTVNLKDGGDEKEPAKDTERHSQWREYCQEHQVSWKPREGSVPRRSVRANAAFWSGMMRAENRPLELATCLPAVTMLRAILLEQWNESLTGVGSRENGGEELGILFWRYFFVNTSGVDKHFQKVLW